MVARSSARSIYREPFGDGDAAGTDADDVGVALGTGAGSPFVGLELGTPFGVGVARGAGAGTAEGDGDATGADCADVGVDDGGAADSALVDWFVAGRLAVDAAEAGLAPDCPLQAESATAVPPPSNVTATGSAIHRARVRASSMRTSSSGRREVPAR